MAASRRLQIAAEEPGTIGLPLRRWRRRVDVADFEQPLRQRHGGVSARYSSPLCRRQVSVAPSGGRTGSLRPRLSRWKRVMPKAILRCRPIWPTDQVGQSGHAHGTYLDLSP
jgi:hypothetical protein